VLANIAIIGAGFSLDGRIYGVTGLDSEVDSVRFGEVVIEPSYDGSIMTWPDGGFNYLLWYRDLYSGQSRYASGDTIVVEVFTPIGRSAAEVKLLSAGIDAPEVVATEEHIELGSEVTVTWHSVPNADYYSIAKRHVWDSAGTEVLTAEVFELTDTSFTVPASETGSNGFIHLQLFSVSGPSSSDGVGNLVGESAIGLVCSSTYSQFTIAVGTGFPYPAGTGEPEDKEPTTTWLDIVQGKYGP